MRTLIHLGMPKAGSTTLQHALNDAREVLLAKGVLYPNPGVPKAYNHGLIVGDILSYENGPRDFRRLSKEDHNKRVVDFLQQLEQQVIETRPEVLILSSEYLWRLSEQWQLNKLQRLLSRLGVEDIEFIAYIRRSSDFFLSAAQQRLRASMKLTPAESYDALSVLRAYEKNYPNARVKARLFDHRNLSGGDVVNDFLEFFIPEHSDTVLSARHTVSRNHTLSAEGMALLQDYRLHFFPEKDDWFNDDTAHFVARLRKVENFLKAPRPVLRPEIREFIDYGDSKPLELRDRYGIVFPDYDYSRLAQGKLAERPFMGNAVRDVVLVSDERLSDLIVALRMKYYRKDENMINWMEQLPERLSMYRDNPLLGWIFRRRCRERIRHMRPQPK